MDTRFIGRTIDYTLYSRDDVDAVIVATPNYLHKEPVVKAAEHGVNVFCEKPIALSYQDCDDMVRACQEHGVIFMAGHVMNFFHGVRHAKKLITEIATTSYGTQLSVINYSQPIDGKPAIILSAPNATNGRKNGKIWIGLINETGQSGVNKYSVEWKYCYSVDTPQMGYSYSCLTELPDGKVGLLYEKYDSWSRNELHLKNILKYEKFTIDELKVQP